jgi:hypothetical protein
MENKPRYENFGFF